MTALRILSAILLAGVLILAHITLAKQAEWNGTFSLETLLVYTNRILPETDIPIRIPETGLPGLDNYFAFMTSFFWSSLDPINIRAHLTGNHLIGTLSSLWLIMLAEAHGNAAKGFLIATYLIETGGELLGIGLFTPIWCIVHLLSTSKPSNVARPGGNLRALGYAIALGHAVPTLLMLRTQPDSEGLESQQLWTILRLFHPIFVLVSWLFFSLILPSSAPKPFGRRSFYIFSILASGFFHATSVGFLLAERMVPGWLTEKVVAGLDWREILLPVPFWSAEVVQKVPFATGVAIFLQWDNICASLAMLIWAFTMYLESKPAEDGLFDILVQSVGVGILAGPGAVSAFLLLRRDSVIAAGIVDADRKQR